MKKQAEIRTFVHDLDINVNNLCQFLPQERVVEFCKLGPEDLLENTEKAVGDNLTFTLHQKLRDMSTRIKDAEQKEKQLVQEEEQNVRVQDKLEDVVARLQAKKQMKTKINNLHVKKPWAEFEVLRKEYDMVRANFTAKQEQLKKDKETLEPLEKMRVDAHKNLSKAESTVSTSHLPEWKQKVKQKLLNMTGIRSKLQTVGDEFKNNMQIESTRKEQIKRLQKEIEVLQIQLANCGDVSDLQPKIKEKEEQLRSVEKWIDQVESERGKMDNSRESLLRKIRETEELIKRSDPVFKRMQKIREESSDVYNAVQWLRCNKEQFRSEIFLPIMTQISVKNPDYMRQIENSIPKKDLFAFVCQDGDDLRKFTDCLQRELKIRVACIMAPNATVDSFQPSMPRPFLKRLGFNYVLKDLIVAPEPIMVYLCQTYKIHEVPVGGEGINNNLQSVTHQLMTNGFKGSVFSNSHRYHLSTSRYDNAPITTADNLPDSARFLGIHTEDDLVTRETERLVNYKKQLEQAEERTKTLAAQVEDLMNQRSKLGEDKRELLAKKDRKSTIETKIRVKNEELKRREVSKFDQKEAKGKMKKLLVDSLHSTLKEMKVKLAAAPLVKQNCRKNLEVVRLRSIFNHFEAQLNLAKVQFKNVERELKQLEEECHRAKKEAKEKREEAIHTLKSQQYQMMPDNTLPENVKSIFESLPETPEDIDEEIKNQCLRMQSLVGVEDESLEEDYLKRREEIKQNKQKLNQTRAERDALKTNFELTRKQWIQALDKVMQKINVNFGSFMQKMGYGGQVVLRAGNDELDDYGICIRVKYRESDELQELSSTHQSGGERSVGKFHSSNR